MAQPAAQRRLDDSPEFLSGLGVHAGTGGAVAPSQLDASEQFARDTLPGDFIRRGHRVFKVVRRESEGGDIERLFVVHVRDGQPIGAQQVLTLSPDEVLRKAQP